MSTDNIATFLSKSQTDPALAERLSRATAEAIASVASQEGLPFTAEEFLSLQQGELSDEALTEVAGGIDIGGFFKELFKTDPKPNLRKPLF